MSAKQSSEMQKILRSLDGKGYPAYKSLYGQWRFDFYTLYVDHVQGDPFAAPSTLRVEVSQAIAKFPGKYYEMDCSRIALEDFLIRLIYNSFEAYNFKAKGSGKSGLISISKCGQEVIERSACEVSSNAVIVRFHVGFPAFGRKIAAFQLEKILFDFIPACMKECLLFENLNVQDLESSVFLAEDQDSLRNQMKENSIVAFVGNNSVLPRQSGVVDTPMENGIPFLSPPSLERSFDLPHRGTIKGMAIKAGITLIVGGGYHGKSTLLEAIQMGVYNHILNDGREFVLTEDSALKLRAEDGRSVKNVDISLFINNLPNKRDTTSFSSEDASGSTSQAANLIEGIESGSNLLLIDEDTSATNFMVRDELMQKVISVENEPITPFLERARDLFEQNGISTIVVAGSSGAFFFISDTIIQMECYKPIDITEKVKATIENHSSPRIKAQNYKLPAFNRVFHPHGDNFRGNSRRGGYRGGGNKYDHMKVRSFDVDKFSLNHEEVIIRYLEQLTDREQTETIAQMVRLGLEQYFDGHKSLKEIIDEIQNNYKQRKWSSFELSYIPCGMAVPRRQEIFGAFNRLRILQ